MPHLSLSFFGSFEVTLDGEPITAFGGDKVRALLAYLAIESARPHRRTELAALLWPDLPDRKAAHNLSQTLLRLRRALRGAGRESDVRTQPNQPPWLLLTGQAIQFNPQCDHQLDVARFTDLLKARRQHYHAAADTCQVCMQWLRQAAELYRGDLLPGFFVPDSIAFEEWRVVKQEALHGQAVETLDQLAAYHERCGEYDQMRAYARRQVALEPWREAAYLQLMRALTLHGQTAAAVEQYDDYRRMLLRELNIQPSDEATALYEQIRSGTLTGRRTDRPTAPGGPNERRQVTALICGRTDSPSHTDPDTLYEQLAACERECEGVLTHYGGQRPPRHGRECLIYFGYPTSHEDNARRAVHAGLAMAASHQAAALPVRIGIHTGLMVVSKQRGPGTPDQELVGDVPDLARGCHNLAEPGSVLITENTARLVRGGFECVALGPQALTGSTDSLEVYRVTSASRLPGRLDWLAHTQHLTPFVGRGTELAQLLTSLDQTRRGQGQVVSVSGQAGIGKSRLVWELKNTALAQMVDDSILWLESRCSPYFQNTTLYPILQLLEQLLGFEANDNAELKRRTLDRLPARFELPRGAAWHLTRLLGLPCDEPVAPTITADERERMRIAWVTLLQNQAAERPLILLIEDLHWSDPSTLEWLERSFDALTAAPCLVLLTFRPTLPPAWLPRPRQQSITLGALSPAETEQLVADLVGETPLRTEVCRSILARTDGIPLFIEELTKTLLESGRQTLEVSETSRVLPEIPATLRDSLTARLDHVGDARETARWAAALGREFSYPVLSAVTAFDDRRLQSDLTRLVEAELIFPQGRAPYTSYAFSHALVQEAAHASLLKRASQDYHRRIAETLEARFTQIAETQPEVIAQHYLQAGLNAQSADHWTRAGERATAQGAILEASIFFDRALELIEPNDHERRWRAVLGRESVLDLRGERAAQKLDVAALLELAEVLDDNTRQAQAYLQQARYVSRQDDNAAMLQAAEAALAAARLAGNLALEVRALTGKVQALTSSGEWAAAGRVVEETLTRAYGDIDDVVRAYALGDAAFYFVEVGDLARAIPLMREGAEAARRAGNRKKESGFKGNLGFTYAQLGLYPRARAALEAALALAEAIGDRRLQASHLINLGFVQWRSGDRDQAQQLIERAREEFGTINDVFGRASSLAYLGFIQAERGEWATATDSLIRAHADFSSIGADAFVVEVQAIEARCLLAQGRLIEARQLAAQVWQYLREHGCTGMDQPSLAYVHIADVFGTIEPASHVMRTVAEAGYRDLMQSADQISNAEWRQSFLDNVTENRTLIEQWNQYQ
ncbi:MAG: AAA family ATPase [Chloroflexi bacterium]|nr:AAA family ATPase [Chloroflexota bacterium]